MLVKFLFVFSIFVCVCVNGKKRHKLVAYWGQNSVSHSTKPGKQPEKPLLHFCKNSQYDVIVLAFINIFFDPQHENMPHLNFANHCWDQKCPKIEQGINECQKQGKKVLLSLGGATEGYGFASDDQAKKLAQTVWNLVLGGDKNPELRPFGSTILDGVDLDIEKGPITGYTQFVREMHTCMEADRSKDYMITGAPQCVYPDGHMGPSPGKPLTEVPGMIDEIYVQFYNNPCYTGSSEFYTNLAKWTDASAKNNGPMVFVGVPSDKPGARGMDYRTPQEMETIYQNIKDNPRFGGFMFWDAGLDQNNIIDGKTYSEHIAAFIGKDTSVPSKAQLTEETTKTEEPKDDAKESKESKDESKESKPKKPSHPIHPSELSCDGVSDGTYAHPTDCAKFFECFQSQIFVKSCPAGLKFNPEERYCDWPANVKCSNK